MQFIATFVPKEWQGHTPHDDQSECEQIKQLFNPLLPIKDFFEQFDNVQDLCTAGGNLYSDV
eukprot:12565211-Ditylum_brightwellii.AAC.1